MSISFSHTFANLHINVIVFAAVISFILLAYSADHLVESAVKLSKRWSLPKVVIGATIVSLGTTLPEACVSVLAVFQGKSSIALGNAVGSIICDTGLILGLICLLSKVPIDKNVSNRQGWLQLAAGFLLVAVCSPKLSWEYAIKHGGYFSVVSGWIFLVLLVLYLYLSIYWAQKSQKKHNQIKKKQTTAHAPMKPIIIKLTFLFVALAFSAEILILSFTEIAHRLHVPESIVAITAIALGTSIPELATAITSVRKGHGEIALGNIIGADILNVLFVAGSAAAFSGQGIKVDPIFFTRMFPAMIILLLTLRIGLILSTKYFNKFFAFLMFAIYVTITAFNTMDMIKP